MLPPGEKDSSKEAVKEDNVNTAIAQLVLVLDHTVVGRDKVDSGCIGAFAVLLIQVTKSL
jgi:hypothetical protein